MSYLKPDFDYDPLKLMLEPPNQEEVAPSKIALHRDALKDAIKEFSKEITDSNLHRFYINSSLSFRTNTNVFDSVAFLDKFLHAFIYSLTKNFPELPSEDLQKIQEFSTNLSNSVANSLKYSNVENKYLLALSLGIIEGMLDYENY